MQKESCAQYAQRRRDRETEAREALRALLPDELFDDNMSRRKDLNITAKVLVAAKTHIEAQQLASKGAPKSPESSGLRVKGRELGKSGATQRPNTARPFRIPTITSAGTPMNEEILQLRQVAQRVVHKAEERLMMTGSMTSEIRKTLNDISDVIIDGIHMIEETF